MSQLNELLRALGEDAGMQKEFEQDADAVMDRYDLTEEEKAALRDGDSEKLRELSGMTSPSITNSSIKSYD